MARAEIRSRLGKGCWRATFSIAGLLTGLLRRHSRLRVTYVTRELLLSGSRRDDAGLNRGNDHDSESDDDPERPVAKNGLHGR